MAHADAKPVLPVLVLEMDIGHSLGIGAPFDGVLLVVHEGEPIHFLAVNGVKECVDGTVARALDLEAAVGVTDRAGKGDVGVTLLVGELGKGVADQLIGLGMRLTYFFPGMTSFMWQQRSSRSRSVAALSRSRAPQSRHVSSTASRRISME